MAETLNFDLVASAWTEVASGSSDVLVQRRGVHPVLVHVGETAPALDAPSAIIWDGEPTFAAGGLGAADKVFARGETNVSTVTVVRS